MTNEQLNQLLWSALSDLSKVTITAALIWAGNGMDDAALREAALVFLTGLAAALGVSASANQGRQAVKRRRTRTTVPPTDGGEAR